MKGILKIDGKEIEIELTEEQTKTVNNALKPKLTGWENLKEEEGQKEIHHYWYIEANGEIWKERDNHDIDDKRYEIANYFSTKEKAEEVAFETELFRKLKRFADENNEYDIGTEDFKKQKWAIVYNSRHKIFNCLWWDEQHSFGLVYFTSKELAEKALETFRPELEKYFGINQK